jgi:DNA polymerase I-like protein with 3'-5' exonuclease and polymerase domains
MRFQTIAPPPTYVSSPEAIEKCFRHCSDSDMLGVDTETLGLLKNPATGRRYDSMTDQVVVMGLCPEENSRYMVPRRYLHHFNPLLENERIPKALTNVKFDAHRLRNTCGAILKGPWADYFQIPLIDYKQLFGTIDPREIAPGHELWEKYLDYGTLDPWATRKLALLLMRKLEQIKVWASHDPDSLTEAEAAYTMKDLYWDDEEPQLKALWEMECRGIRAKKERLEEIDQALTEEMEAIAAELNRRAGRPFNPGSGPQIGQLLFEDLGLPNGGFTATGKYKTDEKVLKKLALGKYQCQEASLILQYKKAQKLRGTYARGLLKWIHTDGRIHTNYSPTKATGRLGSNDPNLQNVPRLDNDPHGIRAVFVPEEGKVFIVADYGQLEMRIMAFAAYTLGDDTMLNAILNKMDMHSFTASKMMGIEYEEFLALKKAGDANALLLRQAAKSVGFGIIYGITKFALAQQLSETLGRYVSEDEAQGYINMYLETFPGVKLYMAKMKRHGRDWGYVQTLRGRFRRLSKLKSKRGGERGHAERQAINAPIQGSAADIVKRAMLLCNSDEYLREDLGFKLLHQVHDELIFEGPAETAEEALNLIQTYMEHPFRRDLPVPLIAAPTICMSWAEGK